MLKKHTNWCAFCYMRVSKLLDISFISKTYRMRAGFGGILTGIALEIDGKLCVSVVLL